MTASRPAGGRESASMAHKMKVASSPATELALTNKVYCSNKDANKFSGSGIVRVRSQLSSTVLTLESRNDVEDGAIALNAIHRRNIKVSANDYVEVAGFVPEKDSDLVMLTVELEFVKFRGKQETLDANNISQKVIMQFGGQVMTKGQKVSFEYIGTNYIFTVKETIFRRDEPKEFGILGKETTVVFETAGNSGIKIANQRGGSNTNLFKRKDLNFQKLGIGGLDKEFVDIFRRAFASRVFPSDVIARMGIQHVKGMLLWGPPGTGKTLIARQIGKMLNAKEPKIVNGPEVLNKYVGGTEEKIRELFADAEADQRSNGDQSELHIIIFDEIDAICKTRGSTRDGTGVHDSIVNQLLTKIDGVESLNNILLIGMTNRKDMLDEALLRPGRLEVQVEIGLPDERGRGQILDIHTKTMRESSYLHSDVRLEEIAHDTKNFSGAELEGLVKSASSFALTRQVNFDDLNKPLNEDIKVHRADFLYALEDVKPAFGAEVATLERCRVNAMLDCGKKHSDIIYSAKNLVEQVMKSERTPLLSCLLEGPSGSGKTAIAATVALESGFPFIKVVSAENMVGLSESTKCGMINKVFEDAYKSPLSIIILDDIERILEFVNIGPRFSNLILQTLLVLIKRLPPKDRKLLIIGTTSMRTVMESMDVLSAFNVSIHVPMLKRDDIEKVLQGLEVFTTDIDVKNALEILPEEMAIKRLLMLLEMSKQGSAAVAAGEGKIDLGRFAECYNDLS